jgi:hypothetical protein
VLRNPSKGERATLDEMVTHAADAVELILTESASAAMARFNRTTAD